MIKASVNGVPCIIRDYFYFDGFLMAHVKYDAYPRTLPVLAQLIEVGIYD